MDAYRGSAVEPHQAGQKESSKKKVPLREGLFVIPSLPEEKPSLLGSRCKGCGKMAFPPRSVCSTCHIEEMEKAPLSREGRLYTYTIIGYPPPGLTAPYAIGYVDLPEGVRVFSILTDWEKTGLEVGMEVELVVGRFRDDKEGNEIVTYKFRPVQGKRKGE
jgi:uncharacterized protein